LSFSDENILEELHSFYKAYENIIDPHTATALASSVQFSSKLPIVGVATASPEKFEDVINQVIPEFSNQSSLKEEEYLILENEIGLIEDAINQHF
jgi:threonine synthase